MKGVLWGIDSTQNDEQEIHQLIADWMAATKAKDPEKVLSLIADDAIFLTPGQAPIYKSDFSEIAQKQAETHAPIIDGISEIQEINILGDWAFIWTKLRVEIQSSTAQNATNMKRAGHTLSILKKENGKWKLTRDANMLVPVND